jgi:hypothetical protein
MNSETEGDDKLNEAAVRRRIKFVIDEARHGMRTKDQAIGVALRVASNYYCIGRHALSYGVKMSCKCVSREALVGRDGDKKSWHNNTTNEHWQPIQKIWEYIVENRETVTPDNVIELLKKYPIVIVTNDENRRLRSIKDWESPEERYERAGIEIMIEKDGRWVPYPPDSAASGVP